MSTLNEYHIGIDLGYGYVKYFSKEGWGAIRSAAANGYQRTTTLLLEGDETEDVYGEIDAVFLSDDPVAIGEQAMGWLVRLDNTRQDFHRSTAALALLRGALLQATTGTGTRPVNTHLTLALPAANFASQKEALLDWLDEQGDVWRVQFVDSVGRTGRKTFTIQSTQVILQPQAHLLGLWMTRKGGVRNTRRALSRTIVIDFGAGTCDIGLFKRFQPKGEMVSPSGGWQIVRSVEKALKAKIPEYNPDRFDLDEIIQGNGEVFYGGQTHDMSKTINNILAKAGTSIVSHVMSAIPNAQNTRNVLVVGGWGERLFPYIQRHIPHATLVTDLVGKNGDWKNELCPEIPIISLASRGCYVFMMNQQSRKAKQK